MYNREHDCGCSHGPEVVDWEDAETLIGNDYCGAPVDVKRPCIVSQKQFKKMVAHLKEQIEEISSGGGGASDETPLTDGEASAGVSEKYSRADHRHGTDETRASYETVQTLSETISAAISSLEERVTALEEKIND